MMPRQEEAMEESTKLQLLRWKIRVIMEVVKNSEGCYPGASILIGKNHEIIHCFNGQEKVYLPPQEILRNDQPPDPFVLLQERHTFVIKHLSDDMKMHKESNELLEGRISDNKNIHEEGNQLAPRLYSFEVDVMKEEGNQLLVGGCSSDVISPSDFLIIEEEGKQAKMDNYSPYHVVNITGENGVVEGDQKMKNESKSFLEFILSRKIDCTPEHDRGTLYAALYGVQLGQVWALGNPLDKLSHFTSAGKGTEELLLSFGQAHPMFLPPIIWSAMFCLNFTCTLMLAWSLPYRVPAVAMLGLSLVYYFLALEGAMSGFNVLLGSTKMSGLMIVSGGAVGLMLLIGFMILGVFYATWRFSQIKLEEN